jgi:hypothetical protein
MRPTAKDHKFRVFLEQRSAGYVVAVSVGKLDGGYRVPAYDLRDGNGQDGLP